MDSSPLPKRLYQVWKGSNRFLCGGRLIFGPDVASMFLSTLLIAAPAIAFFINTYLKIVHKDTKNPGCWYPVLIVGCILTMLDLLFLFLTSSRDPGIICRNSQPPESDEAYDMTTPSMEWVNGRTPHLKLPRTKDVMVNEYTVKVKYCDTCMLYRPPRASHCSICNNCVQRFDHHCPWVGQCIGVRNYRFFFMFISTATVLCIYVFVFSWIHILSGKQHLMKAISHDILSDFLIIYCFIAVWFVGGLTIFHSYLICTNQTTYENFRYRYDKKENPYNKGMIINFIEICFTKIPPSMNKFRSFVEDEEHVVAGSVVPNLEDGFVASKEKIDVEMGAKLAEDSNYSLPEILRNLDYDDDSDDNLKMKEEEERHSFESFIPVEQDAKEFLHISVVGDELGESVQGLNFIGPIKESASSLEESVEGSTTIIQVRNSVEICDVEGKVKDPAECSNSEADIRECAQDFNFVSVVRDYAQNSTAEARLRDSTPSSTSGDETNSAKGTKL